MKADNNKLMYISDAVSLVIATAIICGFGGGVAGYNLKSIPPPPAPSRYDSNVRCWEDNNGSLLLLDGKSRQYECPNCECKKEAIPPSVTYYGSWGSSQ